MPVTLDIAPLPKQRSEVRNKANRNGTFALPPVPLSRRMQVLTSALPLLLSDLVAAFASVVLACGVMKLAGSDWPAEFGLVLLSVPMGIIVSNVILGLYPGTGLHPMVELRATMLSVLLTNGLLLAALLPSATLTAVIVTVQLAALSLLVLLPLLRSLTRQLCGRIPGWGQAALILGDGAAALHAFDAMQDHPDRGLRPVGILGDPMSFDRDMRRYPYAGPVSEAPSMARELSANWAVVAMPNRSAAEISELIDEWTAGIPHVVVTTADEIPSLWNQAFSGPGLSGVHIQRGRLLPPQRMVKRTFDVVACLVGGFLILPLLLLIAAAIRITSPGPVFFKQRRIGQNGQSFYAWKFRTMVVDADRVLEEKLNSNPAYRREWEADHKLKDDPRVTSIGRLLRKTSLDELPQIWNTLKGEMSLVGPRPIVDDEVVKYGRDFDLYTSVLPGISGLWQVSGRNDTTYQQRVDLDSYYVRNWSPWMDIYILSKTVTVLVSRRGAY